jgi:hypothetical protein
MPTTATSNTLSSAELAVSNTSPSIQTDVDKSDAPPSTPPLSSAEEIPSAESPQSPSSAIRGESNINEIDPNAFKITILLASSGYRTQISVNRSFLEKASSIEGDGFLVSQLKNAIWKDWPTGFPLVLVGVF